MACVNCLSENAAGGVGDSKAMRQKLISLAGCASDGVRWRGDSWLARGTVSGGFGRLWLGTWGTSSSDWGTNGHVALPDWLGRRRGRRASGGRQLVRRLGLAPWLGLDTAGVAWLAEWRAAKWQHGGAAIAWVWAPFWA